MRRRELLKLLTSTTALSAMPVEFLTAFREARATATSPDTLRTLNPHQNATVTTVAELILPATETPGATGAKVNEFMDLLLTEWFDQSETKQFLAGLAHLDAESNQRCGADFVACNASQQLDLMKQFDAAAMEFTRTHRTAKINLAPDIGNFFYNFKRLTLVGYYTSEIGFKQELHKTIIPPSHAGCAPLPEVRP